MSSIFIQPIDEILTKLCWCYKCQIKWCHGVSSSDSNPSRNLCLRSSLQFWGNREVAFEEDTISDDDGEDSDCDRLFRAKSCKALVCLSTHMPEQRVAKHLYAWSPGNSCFNGTDFSSQYHSASTVIQACYKIQNR